MSLPPLGRLEQVSLRSTWPDEARNFTPWLALPENLQLLGESLGMVLELDAAEVPVGPFSADLVCRDTADGSWVVIENQIEKTDHIHLGQILTYAAGVGAQTVVWVASKFTDEHRAALDWLNEHTTEKFSFFGLEIELWRIGSSTPAPKFNIISKPNDWAKAVRQQSAAAGGDAAASEYKRLQFEFWTEFKPWFEARSKMRTQAPRTQHWLTVTLGRTGFHLGAILSAWNSVTNSWGVPELRVELCFSSPQAKEQFARLKERAEEFQEKIDLPLVWHNLENVKSCKISVRRDLDFQLRENWPEAFKWLGRYLERFEEVFGPAVRAL